MSFYQMVEFFPIESVFSRQKDVDPFAFGGKEAILS
jgi:hypothetical protein